MTHTESNRRVRYHLRAQMPTADHEQATAALWRLIETMGADEVAFFVPHVEECSLGLGTDEENRSAVERLTPIFEELRRRGIAPSINVFWTFGFSNFTSFERDLRGRFNFRWAVSETGAVSPSIACPHDHAWREQVRRMYATFASLRPRTLWIDDDVRTTLRANVRSACYCDVCVGSITDRTGKRFTRETLVAAILADPPNAVRDAWLASQGEMHRGVVAMLRQAVAEVSPETQVGVMTSPVQGHFAEGRDWPALMDALRPGVPHCRPGLGCYTEGVAHQVAEGISYVAMTQAVLPKDAVVAPEVENYPHSRFFKSNRLVALQMILSQALGASEIMLSFCRMTGRQHLVTDHTWERMFARLRPRLESIAALELKHENQGGIGLMFHPQEVRKGRGRSGSTAFWSMQLRRPWDAALPLLGFATQYGPQKVTLVTGEVPECLSRAELEAIFSKGVLLDARAADSMVRLGLGDWLGLKRRVSDAGATMETIEDAAYGGVAGDVMSLRSEGKLWQFEHEDRARAVSVLRRPDGRATGDGLLVCENTLGGRTGIVPFDSQTIDAIASGSFVTWTRQRQLYDLFTWLNRGPVPMFVAEAPSVYPVCNRTANGWVVAIGNLSGDPVESVKFELGDAPAVTRPWHIRVLEETGDWRTASASQGTDEAGRLSIEVAHDLAHLDVCVLRID